VQSNGPYRARGLRLTFTRLRSSPSLRVQITYELG
jgi:hypothetical protein